MLSLYIHIPFCSQKCNYCNFFVIPVSNEGFFDLRQKYFEALVGQIEFYAQKFPKEQIKTIYFGGGTPLLLGKQQIIEIIKRIQKFFDLNFLEEISFELNPNPYDEVLDFIKTINDTFKDFFRIRYSIGIQSFDDEILKLSGRDYFFNSLIGFIRDLQKYKRSNNVFNFDFIAFGKFNTNKKGEKILRDDKKITFFQNLVESHFLDSFSIYTLELFAGSFWYNRFITESNKEQADENIFQEFDLLKSIVEDAGYQRYEISNFALPGKISIHNNVYWTMGNYLGLGISAHSFLDKEYSSRLWEKLPDVEGLQGTRFENTKSWKDFEKKEFLDSSSIKYLTEKDFLIEKFFLGLRTNFGIAKLDSFKKILIKNYVKKIEEFEKLGFINVGNDTLKLTSKGMDIYNEVLVNLVEDFK